MIQTIFEKLPDVFLKTYEREIMLWAMERDAPTRKIRLLRKPGAMTVLDISHIQQEVELMAETYKHPVSGEIKVMVGPATDFDTEIIELHCQMLPQIKAARAAAAQAWARSGKQVAAHFERVPEAFLRHYDAQFKTWGREFKTRGHTCAVLFDLPPGAKPDLDERGKPVHKGAWFTAHLDWEDPAQPKLVIQPKDEFAQELIEKHTAEMKRHWLD